MEFRAQLFFAASHLSIVALMIVTAQMQDAMQHKNLNFLGCHVSERARIFSCDLGRDGDFARKLVFWVGVGGKALASKIAHSTPREPMDEGPGEGALPVPAS